MYTIIHILHTIHPPSAECNLVNSTTSTNHFSLLFCLRLAKEHHMRFKSSGDKTTTTLLGLMKASKAQHVYVSVVWTLFGIGMKTLVSSAGMTPVRLLHSSYSDQRWHGTYLNPAKTLQRNSRAFNKALGLSTDGVEDEVQIFQLILVSFTVTCQSVSDPDSAKEQNPRRRCNCCASVLQDESQNAKLWVVLTFVLLEISGTCILVRILRMHRALT